MTHQHAPRRLSISGLSLALTLGLLGTAQAATLTRTSAFDYNTSTGLLTKEIIEPGDSNLCLVTEYVYDNFGNKSTATTRNCNGSVGSVPASNSEAVAPAGDPVFTSRTSGNTYDGRGQFPTTSSNALSQAETKTYNANYGTVASLTGPNGLATSWNYDGFGRKTRETRADGTRTKWEYLYCSGINDGTAACPTIGGAAGAYVVVVTPLSSDGVTQNGPVSKTYYDALNREIRSETQGYDGSGTSTAIYKDTQYDSLGRPYKTSRPYYSGQTVYWATVAYDGIGRVISETQPPDGTSTNTTTTTAYNGLTVTVTNANNQTRTTVKNSQGQVVSVTDAQAKTITYAYDAFGNLATTTDALGNVVTLSYDLRGRKFQMIDPDMGTWTYAYDALGQLVRQVDAKNQVTTMAYDLLGRMTNRSEADLISTWYYDTYKGGGACNKGIGKLCQSETDHGYNKTVNYDSYGRYSSASTLIDTPYTDSVTYDDTATGGGRAKTRVYPSGLSISYVYTALGYLKQVTNTGSGGAYWTANSLDAEGHLLQQTYGNGVITQQNYDASNGRITSITAGKTGTEVQNLTFLYDSLGNVSQRNSTYIDLNNATQTLQDSFLYDALNRLTKSTVNATGGIVTTDYAYDAIGNITSRGYLGTYTYNDAAGASSIRPHAVTRNDFSATSPWPNQYRTYQYDANGNLTGATQYNASQQQVYGPGKVATFTSFNMHSVIYNDATGQVRLELSNYGPEHQRLMSTIVDGAGTRSTVYLNPDNAGGLFYEKETKPTGVEQRNFISAMGQVIAIVKYYTDSNGGTSIQTRYLHHDNLGSVTAETDWIGRVMDRRAYEPFGTRRQMTGWINNNYTTNRGFTGHEHFDELDIVHMNGRIYDPVIGRFMSADPYIQAPGNLQSYNRYSYVLNNPLLYTDPSGYFSLRKLFKAAVVAVAAYYTAGAASSAYAASAATSAAAATGAAAGTAAYTAAYSAAYATAIGSTTAAMIGGASGGFTAGFLASGGNVEAGLYGAAGGAIGGAFVGSGAFGQMLGSGINGYLQTGTTQGFARGFAAGAIPQDLWFGDVYKKDAFANVAIGITRDGIRGSLAAGSFRGFGDGVIYGQATNAFGHLYGAVSSNFASPMFRDGAFYYPDTRNFGARFGYTAITFGNTITGIEQLYAGALSTDYLKWLDRHERGHIDQAQWMGATYLPLQAVSQWTGSHIFEHGPFHPLGYETMPRF